MWLQWDWGEGPRIDGRRTSLWCAWLAWSRFRVVIPVLDKTLPTVAACLDTTFRQLGGAPTYCLTDNEKTVTVEHVARIAVRNPELVPIARYYGTVVRSCMPADPASKGGTEATVRIAKRDLVPTAVNLRTEYVDFAELQEVCEDFMAEVNGRIHRETRRIPAELLAEERPRLHPVPEQPFTTAFGETRRVEGLHHLGRVGPLLVPAPARRRARLGPIPRRRADRHRDDRRQRGRGRSPPALDAGQSADRG